MAAQVRVIHHPRNRGGGAQYDVRDLRRLYPLLALWRELVWRKEHLKPAGG